MLSKELRKKLKKAKKSGKYLIAITYIDDKGDYQHFWETRSFPKSSVLEMFDYHKNDYSLKELHKAKEWI